MVYQLLCILINYLMFCKQVLVRVMSYKERHGSILGFDGTKLGRSSYIESLNTKVYIKFRVTDPK
jgi:hypothetical protein